MELTGVFHQLGLALGLGLLVGLQRERSESRLAGFRTFPLITVLGTLCALLSERFGGWVVATGFLSLAAMIVVGNLAKQKTGELDPGLTTEAAMLVMFGLGAYLTIGSTIVTITVGAGVAVLLHLKPQLHSFAARLGENDFKAIMQFVLISLVILPVLPNEAYGPYQVLNPHKIWLMVVLIVGLSLGGYVVYKIFGEKVGALAGGILGGMISSTATTVSYARRSRQAPESGGLAALVIMTASTVVFVRVLLEMSAVAPAAVSRLAPPLLAMLLVMTVLSAALIFSNWRQQTQMPVQENPSELKPAIFFAALFAAVLLAGAAAKENFGSGGLYFVAVLSGLTDMDAITLSTLQMINTEKITTDTGWRLILAASMANLVFKAGTVAVLGDRQLFGRIALLFALAFAAGAAILAFWPG